MIRAALFAALILVGTSAKAWEFTPGIPCLLTGQNPSATVELTYDPTAPLYTISITRSVAWPPDAVFSIRFEGPNPLTISTNRHRLSGDKRRLTVTDRGFGNVLNGMQFNNRMVAIVGALQVEMSLQEASGPVASFRACKGVPSA